jgi:hypothetical protein
MFVYVADFSMAFVDLVLTFLMPKKVITNRRLDLSLSIDAVP